MKKKKQRLKEYQKSYYKTKERYSNENKKAIKEKSQKRFSNEKAAEYYAQNKEAIALSFTKTCHKKKKIRLKSTKEKGTKN